MHKEETAIILFFFMWHEVKNIVSHTNTHTTQQTFSLTFGNSDCFLSLELAASPCDGGDIHNEGLVGFSHV